LATLPSFVPFHHSRFSPACTGSVAVAALRVHDTVKSSSDGRARHCNRSGVVDLVEREPLIIARVENGVTKFSPQRHKKAKIFKKKLDQGNSFQWGIFILFFGRGKTNFFGGGYNVKTG
jgi:hypothetical protein